MIHNIYPTPIYISKLNLTDTIKDRIELIKTTYDISNPWNDGANSSFKHGNSKNSKIKHFNDLDNFIKLISLEVEKYISDVGGKNINFTIEESWVNFTNKDQYQHFHMHSKYDIVGIYYFKAEQNNGYLQLENPIAVSEYSLFPSNIGKNQTVCIQPQTGTIILFPAWLRHAVYKNPSNEERISVSFNIKIHD